jgi:hypothetical protein
MFSSIGPFLLSKPQAPSSSARLVGHGGVVDADRDGAHRRAVLAREALRERILLGVDDEVDLALAVQGHVLVAVARDGGKAHLLEQRAERFRIRRRVLDELETVGPHRVVPRREIAWLSPVLVAHSIVRSGRALNFNSCPRRPDLRNNIA